MPQLSQANLLSVWAGACQPQGGVPRYLAADLDLIFCNKNTKKAANLSWTACKNLPKMLGKDSIICLEGSCSVSVRKMNRNKERKPLERSKLITTRGYELLINAQSKTQYRQE
jgi:hypothetical protein